MNEDKIIKEAINYSIAHIDENMSEDIKDQLSSDMQLSFIAGAKWMQEQLRLSNVSNSVVCPQCKGKGEISCSSVFMRCEMCKGLDKL